MMTVNNTGDDGDDDDGDDDDEVVERVFSPALSSSPEPGRPSLSGRHSPEQTQDDKDDIESMK